MRAKNVWNKSSEKRAKNVFLFSNEYRELKMGEETRETIYPETQE